MKKILVLVALTALAMSASGCVYVSAKPKNVVISPGKSKKVTIFVENRNEGLGEEFIRNGKICAKFPSSKVKVTPKCRRGNIAVGKTKKAKFKIRVKNHVKKQTIYGRFVATAPGQGRESTQVKIRVRGK